MELLQVRGGYTGEYGRQWSLDARQLHKDPTNEPLESMPVRLIGWFFCFDASNIKFRDRKHVLILTWFIACRGKVKKLEN